MVNAARAVDITNNNETQVPFPLSPHMRGVLAIGTGIPRLTWCKALMAAKFAEALASDLLGMVEPSAIITGLSWGR